MTDLKFDVEPLYNELLFSSDVWDEIPYRTNFKNSPHREVHDIWVRYNALRNYYINPQAFNSEHTSVWYPVIGRIPSARYLAECLMDCLQCDRLGGVIITKVPPRGKVYPHADPGWHARYYEKFIIQVRGNSKQAFCFEGEELRANSGECYWFDNQFPHWVINDSDEDRISLIVCVKRSLCH